MVRHDSQVPPTGIQLAFGCVRNGQNRLKSAMLIFCILLPVIEQQDLAINQFT